jgi:hypothetical protein
MYALHTLVLLAAPGVPVQLHFSRRSWLFKATDRAQQTSSELAREEVKGSAEHRQIDGDKNNREEASSMYLCSNNIVEFLELLFLTSVMCCN